MPSAPVEVAVVYYGELSSVEARGAVFASEDVEHRVGVVDLRRRVGGRLRELVECDSLVGTGGGVEVGDTCMCERDLVCGQRTVVLSVEQVGVEAGAGAVNVLELCEDVGGGVGRSKEIIVAVRGNGACQDSFDLCFGDGGQEIGILEGPDIGVDAADGRGVEGLGVVGVAELIAESGGAVDGLDQTAASRAGAVCVQAFCRYELLRVDTFGELQTGAVPGYHALPDLY